MSRRVLRLRSAALMRFSAIRADLTGPHRKRRSPISLHVAGTSDGFPPPDHRGNMRRFHLAALPIIRPESEPSRRDKCEGSDPNRGGYVYVHTTCNMEVSAGHVAPPKRGGSLPYSPPSAA